MGGSGGFAAGGAVDRGAAEGHEAPETTGFKDGGPVGKPTGGGPRGGGDAKGRVGRDTGSAGKSK
jgi:hypothetical protein